ncbi:MULTISPECIES: cardiolipin synthase [Bacillus]|uniref:cardiolipin synthase n=1 Tax=Bacillus TaxID=1386 RepID=UPI0011A5D4F2|nr:MULTISPECIES: cardiolipin synthase [Bacillus]MBU8724876.1 cardiolipin synthase [Bacillus pumilus]MCP1150479.1 cardiolipin synthase [Bacillus sp. 1735sda2]QHQ74875.1 cardiolipin synthase [Bacillus pumilus]
MIALIILLVLIVIVCLILLDLYMGKKYFSTRAFERSFDQTSGDAVFYHDGEPLFNQLLTDIQHASSSIHMMFFIVKNDKIGQRVLQALKTKAKQGVSVFLLTDRLGSYPFDQKSIDMLEKSGIQFYFLNKPRFPFLIYRLNMRNHRKITVIDGKIGYIGGFNIGDEYVGKKGRFGIWKDYHLRMTGQVVADLQHVFLNDLYRTSGIHQLQYDVFPALEQGTLQCTTRATAGFSLEALFLKDIQQARKQIIICTPYFIPSAPLLNALLDARKRGVTVEIIIPMKADHPLVKEAGFHYLKDLIASGCLVYRFYKGFYHAKAILIDQRRSIISTANFDKRSLFLNEEVDVAIDDVDFTSHVEGKIREHIEVSELMTEEKLAQRPLLSRMLEWAAAMFSYFL